MIKFIKKLFSKHSDAIPKVDGFYVDTNTQNEQSKTAWVEYMRDSKGNLIPIIPKDRIEIH